MHFLAAHHYLDIGSYASIAIYADMTACYSSQCTIIKLCIKGSCIFYMPNLGYSSQAYWNATAYMNKRMDLQLETNYYVCYSEDLDMPGVLNLA